MFLLNKVRGSRNLEKHWILLSRKILVLRNSIILIWAWNYTMRNRVRFPLVVLRKSDEADKFRVAALKKVKTSFFFCTFFFFVSVGLDSYFLTRLSHSVLLLLESQIRWECWDYLLQRVVKAIEFWNSWLC